MGYKIGSFNVKNLSADNGDKIKKIAEIILKEKFDIVALQEVLNAGQITDGGLGRKTGGVAELYRHVFLRSLPGYDMRFGASNIRKNSGDKRGEGCAFIWNKKRIELAKQITPLGKRVFNPQIVKHYGVKRVGGVKLARDPFYGRFKIKGIRQEIRLITTHVSFGSNDKSGIRKRKEELNTLIGSIYPRLHDKTYGINTPAVTLVLGDYNLNLMESGAGAPYVDKEMYLDENGHRWSYVSNINNNIRSFCTIQNQLSTLSSNSEQEKYSNNYDHVTYETSVGGRRNAHDGVIIRDINAIRVSELPIHVSLKEYMDIFSSSGSIIEAFSKDKKFIKYRESVSDHLPICIDLDFRS